MAVPQYPYFRGEVPKGQSVLLTNSEFKDMLTCWDEHEKKYKKHIEKLSAKKKPNENGQYEIKTPIPSHPDRCFVCQISIPEGVDYKEHLVSEQHRKCIENDKLYGMIDDVIAELSLKAEIEQFSKPAHRSMRTQVEREIIDEEPSLLEG